MGLGRGAGVLPPVPSFTGFAPVTDITEDRAYAEDPGPWGYRILRTGRIFRVMPRDAGTVSWPCG
jgi:hypothetical protein